MDKTLNGQVILFSTADGITVTHDGSARRVYYGHWDGVDGLGRMTTACARAEDAVHEARRLINRFQLPRRISLVLIEIEGLTVTNSHDSELRERVVDILTQAKDVIENSSDDG